MKKTIGILLLITLLLAGMPISLAQAHNGPPRLELGAERAAPGVGIEVRGVNISPEQPVTLTLVGGGQEFGFGTVMGNEHGDFIQVVIIPREAQAGTYTMRAFGLNRVMVAAPLTIMGQANDEEGQQRDEEEPLLAPLPLAQPAAPAVAPAAAAVPAPASVPTAQGSPLALWLAVALVALAAVASLTLLARRRAASILK